MSLASLIVLPRTPLTNAGEVGEPNSLANSIASSIMTLVGNCCWLSSKKARRRIERSIRLILSNGHLGALRRI